MTHHCPNCGAALEGRFDLGKIIACAYCDTTSFVDGETLRMAGKKGAFHARAGVFALGAEITVAGQALHVIGRAQFDYGQGRWEEYWCTTGTGSGKWLSVDEGDIILQHQVNGPDIPKPGQREVSYSARIFERVERGSAICVAVDGILPEDLSVGERHFFSNFQHSKGDVLSLEQWDASHLWFLGKWIAPEDIDWSAAHDG